MNAETTGRVPRQDLDAEAAVLSSLLLEPLDKWPDIEPILLWSDFYSPANAAIYGAIGALYLEGRPIDSMTVASWLKDRGRLQEIGGVPYLARIVDAAPSVANAVAYAETILRCSRQRQTVALAQRIAADGYGDVGDVDRWIESAEDGFRLLSQGSRSTMSYEPIREIVRGTVKDLEEQWRTGIGARRVLTGLPRLDNKLAMLPGDLVIVGARPGMGKTAFVGGMMVHVTSPGLWPDEDIKAWKGETLVAALHSQEMPKEQIALRLLCTEARVDLEAVRRGKVSGNDWPALAQASQRIASLPLFIDEKPGITLEHVRKNVRALKREIAIQSRITGVPSSLQLVVVDYLQLMKFAGRNNANKSELVGDVTRGLKILAKEEHVVVVLLSQLNRALEARDNKRPMMSDLRDSGEIEQDADAILFLYRHGYYHKDTPHPEVAEIIIGKQRNGGTDRVPVRWTGAHTMFSELSESELLQLRWEAEEQKTQTKKTRSEGGW